MPVKDQSALTVATALYDNVITRYGPPTSLLSDRGTAFLSKVVEQLCKRFNIKRVYTSAYHPQCNANVERVWSVLWAALRSYCESQSDWESHLSSIAYALRATPNASSNFSPSLVVLGRELALPMQAALLPSNTGRSGVEAYVRQLLQKLQIVRQVAADNLQAAQATHKKYYDRNQHPAVYLPGDLVWLNAPYNPPGISSKLRRKFEGPYYVVSRTENDTYRLRNSLTNELMSSAVHLNRLRPFDNDRQVLWDRFNDLMASSQPSTLQPLDTTQPSIQPDVADTTDDGSTEVGQPLPGLPPSPLPAIPSSNRNDSLFSDASEPPLATSAADVSPSADVLAPSPDVGGTDTNAFPLPSTSSHPLPSSSQGCNDSQDPVSSSPSSSSQIWFPASKLLACKVQNGRRLYKVKWLDEKFKPTWEKSDDVTPALKDAFHASYTWAGKKKRKTATHRASILTLSFIRLLTVLFILLFLFSL